jgi:hypothetical protein
VYGLCQQLGTDNYLRTRDLRRTILRWLHLIQVFWRDCPASVGNDGKSLQLRPARIIQSPAVRHGFTSTTQKYKYRVAVSDVRD